MTKRQATQQEQIQWNRQVARESRHKKDWNLINNVGWIGVIVTVLITLLIGTQCTAQTMYEVKYQTQADLLVYEVQYPEQADIRYWIAPYQSQANETKHHWYWVQYQSQADYTIYWVKYRSQADRLVHQVQYPTETR